MVRVSIVVLGFLIGCGPVTGGSRGGDAGSGNDTGAGADAGLEVVLGSASVSIRRGDIQTLSVSVTRGGTSGELSVTLTGAPAGVTADALTLEGSSSAGTLVLHAAATATEGVATATVAVAGSGVSGSAALRLVVAGAPGTLDQSFASGGKFLGTLPGMVLIGRGLALAGDDIVVTGGTSTQAITARLRGDGSFDTRFNGGAGFVSTGTGTYSEGIAVTILGDDRIIVAGVANGGPGDYDFGLFGYSADGALDPGFGDSGVAALDPGSGYGELRSIGDAGDSIVVAGTLFGSAGTVTSRILRYSYAGVRDPGFDAAEPDVYVQSLAVQSDGKVVVAGSTVAGSFWLARYSSTGARDTGFGSGGIVTTDFAPDTAAANGLALLPGGKLLAIGVTSQQRIALARYNLNGSLDLSFGVGGKVTTSLTFDTRSTNAAAVDPSGKIALVGVAGGRPAVARVNADGTPDEAFGAGAIAAVDFGVAGTTASTGGFGIAIDADGRIVFAADVGSAGAQKMAVARLWP